MKALLWFPFINYRFNRLLGCPFGWPTPVGRLGLDYRIGFNLDKLCEESETQMQPSSPEAQFFSSFGQMGDESLPCLSIQSNGHDLAPTQNVRLPKTVENAVVVSHPLFVPLLFGSNRGKRVLVLGSDWKLTTCPVLLSLEVLSNLLGLDGLDSFPWTCSLAGNKKVRSALCLLGCACFSCFLYYFFVGTKIRTRVRTWD